MDLNFFYLSVDTPKRDSGGTKSIFWKYSGNKPDSSVSGLKAAESGAFRKAC